MGSDRALRRKADGRREAESLPCGRIGKFFRPGATLCALALTACLLCGCKASNSSSTSNSGSTQPRAAQTPRTDFEKQLEYVRTGQFHHIYVFSRKDGGVFDRDDVDYLTANSPVGEKTNMRVKTEDGRRVIIGTNFEYEQAQFDALSKRFNIEDYTGR
jgi:hypothetical protein